MKANSQELLDLLKRQYQYDAATGNFSRNTEEQCAGWVNVHGYRVIALGGLSVLAHRAAYALANGCWPSLALRHINGNKLDNRLDNLRIDDGVSLLSKADDLSWEYLRLNYFYDPAVGVFSDAFGPMAVDVGRFGYHRVTLLGKRFLVHRLAWFYCKGAWPIHAIDHINRNRSDNRIENLRDVERWKNSLNRTNKSGASGIRGVSWCKRKQMWHVAIRHAGQHYNLGYFHDKHEGGRVYAAAALRLRGEEFGRIAA